MQTVQSQLEKALRAAIFAAFNIDADPILGIAQNEKFGDYQSNAAMGLAKQLTLKNPRAVAEQIIAKLDLGEMATEKPAVAGPGFINVKLNPEWIGKHLHESTIEKTTSPQVVVVDYSGPNIAKQMHVGHLRSTIIGDAISRVIEERGDQVIRQNHIGDWGTQFGMLIAHLKNGLHSATPEGISAAYWKDGSPFGDIKIRDLEGFYRESKRAFDEDPVFQDISRQTVVRLQQGNNEERAAWKTIVDETRKEYLPIYERLNVKLEQKDERGESFYNPFLADVVKELRDKSIAKESDGAIVVFVDGEDKSPLIIRKSDGGYLYGTTDLAGIRFRINELHANRITYVHDSRQAQHFRQVFDTAKKASWTRGDEVKLEYAPFGTMLGEDGKPFKTRSGDTVKLKDLLDEAEDRAFKVVSAKNPELPENERRDIAKKVGIGAVKYADLSKDRISDYVFSWDKMLSLDGNTAPYLQYAYARIQSIFRKAGDSTSMVDESTVPRLDSPFEIALAKHILRLGEIVELVARELKPHHLCTYLYDLAVKFSGFYENCPVLQSEEPTRTSRLILCRITAKTLAKGLDLLGIEHPEQM